LCHAVRDGFEARSVRRGGGIKWGGAQVSSARRSAGSRVSPMWRDTRPPEDLARCSEWAIDGHPSAPRVIRVDASKPASCALGEQMLIPGDPWQLAAQQVAGGRLQQRGFCSLPE